MQRSRTSERIRDQGIDHEKAQLNKFLNKKIGKLNKSKATETKATLEALEVEFVRD